MKTIGLLGGMSWKSTATYYRLINEGINKRLGRNHSAKINLISFNFEEIETLHKQGDWITSEKVLINAAKNVEETGADFLAICTNTMHKHAPEVEASIHIPILHIADATGQKLIKDGKHKIGLLGTRFTMSEGFYKDRLYEKYGLEVIVPDEKDRRLINNIIYDELCKGITNNVSRNIYVDVIETLSKEGAEAVILGCTEIPLLVQQEHTLVPLYDTTLIHAESIVQFAIDD